MKKSETVLSGLVQKRGVRSHTSQIDYESSISLFLAILLNMLRPNLCEIVTQFRYTLV
jgi:hypothetical protein